jgi:AraC-like DNA-binding protein
VDAVSRTWIGVFSQEFIASFSRKYENACFSSFSCDPQIEKMLCKYLFVKNIPEHYMLTSCLYMVCNECEKNADKRELAHGELKRAIVDTMMENVSFDITLGDVADRLGYEYHYLSGLFNECFDMNYKGLVNVLRQDLACRLLQDKNKDIATISEECGFGSVRNFNRVFKKMSGLTPREYRYQK